MRRCWRCERRAMTTRRLDRYDLEILRELQRNARQTNQQLSEAVALSASACLARVRRLEKTGLVRAYVADLNLEKVAPYVEVVAQVTLRDHSLLDFRRFDQAVAEMPEIVEALQVNGPFDYLIRIVCRDVPAYRDLIDHLTGAYFGIERITSQVVLSRTKHFSGYPIERLEPV